jgi:hypothetical protein
LWEPGESYHWEDYENMKTKHENVFFLKTGIFYFRKVFNIREKSVVNPAGVSQGVSHPIKLFTLSSSGP